MKVTLATDVVGLKLFISPPVMSLGEDILPSQVTTAMSCLCSLYLCGEIGRLSDAIVTPTGAAGIGQRAFHNKSMSLEGSRERLVRLPSRRDVWSTSLEDWIYVFFRLTSRLFPLYPCAFNHMLQSIYIYRPEGDVIKAYQSTLSIKIWESATQYLQLFGKNKDNVPKKIPEMYTSDWSKQSRKELYETIMDGTITKNDFINGIQNLVVSPFSQDLFLFIKISSRVTQ
jgi:hypothetical protein